MRVYLCGPINGRSDDDCKTWREYAKTRLPDTLDPLRRDYRGRELEEGLADKIVTDDEDDIAASDVVLAYFDKPSVGTAMEIRMAKKELKKRVVLVNKSNAPLSPWLVHHSEAIFTSLDEAIDHILLVLSVPRPQ